MSEMGDMTEGQLHVLADIAMERDRQDEKWGAERNLAFGLWFLVLGEEFGEMGKAVLERSKVGAVAPDPNQAVRAELVQVAAVCVAWIEDLDRRSAALVAKR